MITRAAVGLRNEEKSENSMEVEAPKSKKKQPKRKSFLIYVFIAHRKAAESLAQLFFFLFIATVAFLLFFTPV